MDITKLQTLLEAKGVIDPVHVTRFSAAVSHESYKTLKINFELRDRGEKVETSARYYLVAVALDGTDLLVGNARSTPAEAIDELNWAQVGELAEAWTNRPHTWRAGNNTRWLKH